MKDNYLVWLWCSTIQYSTVHSTMMSLENMTSPNHHQSKFCKNKGFLTISLESLNWPYYHYEKGPWKQDNSVTFIHLKICAAPVITSWKFCKNKAVLLMTLENLTCSFYHAEIFAKARQFWWYHLKIWVASIITSWQFLYYHELKVTWIFGLSLISRGKIFSKIRQFCWCDLKIWPAPIIASSNFRKNKAVLMVSL